MCPMRRFQEEGLRPGDLPVEGGSLGKVLTDATRSLAPALLVVTAFLGCAWLSWRRLGSLIIDGGHELDVPRRLLEGAALYRDVAWNWGPFAPWVNSALYRVFGVHSDTLMWAGLVTAALACLGLCLLARRFVGPLTAAWVGVAFLVACAFCRRIDHAIFNFVLPFNFSATYGITLAVWSVLLLAWHARSGRPATLAGSAALAGLVALTKIETTFAVVVAHAAFLLTVLPRPSRARVLAWGCGLAVATVGYAVASWASDGRVWSDLVELANPAARFYIAETMGVRQLGRSLVDVALSLLTCGILLAAAGWSARGDLGPVARGLRPLAWIVLLAVPALALEARVFRAAPLLLGAGLVWIVSTRVREGESALDGRWREELVVWAFALGALPRILLRAGTDHYGFYLLPPTFVCVAIGISRYLGAGGRDVRSPRRLAFAASTVLAGMSLGALLVSYRHLTGRVTEVKTARVHLLVDPRGPEAFIPFLSALPSTTVCAAVPEGAGIIFAAGLTPPADGLTAYLPMVLERPGAERGILEAWQRAPPEVIVFWGADQSAVFGYAGFGKDYGLALARWISERYDVGRRSPDGRSTLLVARRGGEPRGGRSSPDVR